MPLQHTFAEAEFDIKGKTTRREKFLANMEKVVPWTRLLALLQSHIKPTKTGRPRYNLNTMLRIQLMQNWFGYSDLAMEEALYEVVTLRRFAGLAQLDDLPDETTILKFRHFLERHELSKAVFEAVNQHLTEEGLLLRTGTLIDATIIHAPTSTKNQKGERDPEMHQTRKGNQWYHGMKAHVGVDMNSGLVHTVTATAANVADIAEAAKLLHGDEARVLADAGYIGLGKRPEMADVQAELLIAARRSTVEKLTPELREIVRAGERVKAQVRSRVEHVFQVLKCQFGYVKVRYRGLEKNLAHLHRLFMLVNLKMACRAFVG